MTDLQIFSNPEFGQVRTVVKDGQPWFVGKDVAEVLGYANPQKALRDHVDIDDKGVNEMDTPGGKQQITIINESGLYALIFGSQLEGAQRFKRWVTGEVLPSIRKTGAYTHVPQTLLALQGMINQMVRQEEAIAEANRQSQKAIETTKAIREAIIKEYDDWRRDINHKVADIQKGMNKSYQDTWSELYADLEKRAHCDLAKRVNNGRYRLNETGATKSAIAAYCRLDAIETDPRLKEIFTAIVKEYAVKYVA